jgi:hypothetical protein
MSRVPSTVPPEGSQIPPRHPKAPEPGTKIPSHFGHCFGCGELHPTGLHLVAHAGDGQNLTAVFTVTENHQGAPGLAHGGLLSLAFDEALGKLMWLIRSPAVTARLETDFLLMVTPKLIVMSPPVAATVEDVFDEMTCWALLILEFIKVTTIKINKVLKNI